jgi:hypothetical protein
MSSHDLFSVSGSSPTKKKAKWDFRVEFHGSICLLVPLSSGRGSLVGPAKLKV